MTRNVVVGCLAAALLAVAAAVPAPPTAVGDTTVDDWLSWFNETITEIGHDDVQALWTYETDITDEHLDQQAQQDAKLLAFQLEAADNASRLLETEGLTDVQRRTLTKISKVGLRLNDADAKRYSLLRGNMSGTYSTATICGLTREGELNCTGQWHLTPELDDFLLEHRDYDSLVYVWKSWHENAGRPIRDTYKQFVDLSNKGARADGFDDTGHFWRSLYEDPEFQKHLDELWYQVLPLYEKLHAYVRKKLKEEYGDRFTGNAIPAHLFGNMWAQDWSNIPSTTPYPDKGTLNVTGEMIAQGYDARKMFDVADNFFQSMGLIALPDDFYNISMIEKPSDRDNVVCHAESLDFYYINDVRIKMCTNVNMNDLIVIHHEQGHVQYFMQYANQRFTFRDGANPGFHEAIGDTVALSVSTTDYMKTIGLLKDEGEEEDPERDLNVLFRTAAEKVAFLPFGLLIDKWRWNVFNESVSMDNWNTLWWAYRFQYQGLVPPVPRDPRIDFDPGAKFHVPANSAYIQYFVSYILQFQFYRRLCELSGYDLSSKPLYKCNFFNSKDAGVEFGKMLQQGSSRPWPDVLKDFVGTDKMDASAIIDYFKPLDEFLTQQVGSGCYGWGQRWPDEVMETLPKNRCPRD